jgi:pyruvate formate lyase activating enzyme
MLVSSLALDPIEKKPLARFHPGSMILSVGSVGCTLHCPWCQNHEIAQPDDPDAVPTREMDAGTLADTAEALRNRGNIGLAYTYNEPLAHWRDVAEVAREVHARGMLNVMVTNGMAGTEALDELLPLIDAWNIDLKGVDQHAYDVCGGRIDVVKRTIARAAETSHVEVTWLMVPGVSDDPADVETGAAWLATVDPSIPLHITRFFPQFRYADRKPTSLAAMRAAEELARLHLDDVLLGNV